MLLCQCRFNCRLAPGLPGQLMVYFHNAFLNQVILVLQFQWHLQPLMSHLFLQFVEITLSASLLPQ